MTRRELDQALAQYRAGLEAELQLLRQLAALSAAAQRPEPWSPPQAVALADDRDRVIASISSIEHGLTPLREVLTAAAPTGHGTARLNVIADLHLKARELLARIAASDRHTIELLMEARRARQGVEDAGNGDATLHAYRRVVAPPLEGARIVDRRG